VPDELTVSVRGLVAYGRHGVLPAETELGQRFSVDVDAVLRSARAAETDAVEDTIDYAWIADVVAGIVSGAPHALIERVAGRIADAVLAAPAVGEVVVTVRKPAAPVPHVIETTRVTLRRSAERR